MNKYFKVFVFALSISLFTTVDSFSTGYVPVVSQNITSTVNTARFIMFGGVYADDSGNPVNAVFKLDTYTGNVWMLEVKKDSHGKIVKNWVAIENPQAVSVNPENDSLQELPNINK
jgi:hypothetical protein